ncbi:shikimate dehydrogenase [Candidatus Synechococcus calcipolaris G9]|uniref:Shikimate dehydrogenase (NADP(+)) n=1 Tax=Candidatus Synechococcus calcipolaris G9 TaxID=1497997 RepID=A0ABT6F0G6_9SYNE|nr:shikimate dehydrogenase [Candidatus Synechococcus calcipolaris]MDG2991356.1 shikimate dehydrogenase [Candidatus Synechococcus calcipolaris G9]
MKFPIVGTTQLLGVIGDPIGHTLSPVIHNRALAALGLDYVYLPFAVKPADMAVAIAGLGALNVQGFNVTIPHKQSVIAHLGEITPLAAQVGAVNTVWPTEKGWAGTNTDVQGFLAPLRSLSQSWQETQVMILGYGGAARAVVAACDQLGCQGMTIAGRNPEKLAAFGQSWPQLKAPLKTILWEHLTPNLSEAALVVNTTPIGMAPHGDQSPLSQEQLAQLASTAIVYDLIYKPRPTRLLAHAHAQGLHTIDGLEMLIHQGAIALEQWIGQPPDITVMINAAQEFLGLNC